MSWYAVLALVVGGLLVAGLAIRCVLVALVKVLVQAWWEGR